MADLLVLDQSLHEGVDGLHTISHLQHHRESSGSALAIVAAQRGLIVVLEGADGRGCPGTLLLPLEFQ
jgi:hypothetical protein